MKTTIKKNLVVALMLGTLVGYAKESIISNDNDAKETVKIEFKNVKKGQVLTIKDVKGVTIYNKEIKSQGNYARIFNFSALEDGTYTAELNKAFEILVKKFEVKNGLVTFLSNENKKIFKPVIRTNKNRLYVSKLTFNQNPIKVNIFYRGDIILSETLEGEELLNRIYKLSENHIGDYKIIVKSNNRSYSKDFTI